MQNIIGNTYPVREKLKALGARWNAAERCWTISDDRAEEARAIVAGKMSPADVDATSSTNSLPWSEEQTAIFAWFATGTGNLVVQARAGTGKTTTIKQAFSHAPETGRLLYAVFNKKNQREAQEKITDARVEVKTLHSLGFYFIKKVWPNAAPDDFVEAARVALVAPALPEEVASAIVKLVGFCKNLTVGKDCANILAIETKIICLFEDSDSARKPAVVCSSVHKAKGLEWNKVCLVEDTFKNRTAGEESNIYYVAVTRTKKVLVRAYGKFDNRATM